VPRQNLSLSSETGCALPTLDRKKTVCWEGCEATLTLTAPLASRPRARASRVHTLDWLKLVHVTLYDDRRFVMSFQLAINHHGRQYRGWRGGKYPVEYPAQYECHLHRFPTVFLDETEIERSRDREIARSRGEREERERRERRRRRLVVFASSSSPRRRRREKKWPEMYGISEQLSGMSGTMKILIWSIPDAHDDV
jgi:hypothetical protein